MSPLRTCVQAFLPHHTEPFSEAGVRKGPLISITGDKLGCGDTNLQSWEPEQHLWRLYSHIHPYSANTHSTTAEPKATGRRARRGQRAAAILAAGSPQAAGGAMSGREPPARRHRCGLR